MDRHREGEHNIMVPTHFHFSIKKCSMLANTYMDR